MTRVWDENAESAVPPDAGNLVRSILAVLALAAAVQLASAAFCVRHFESPNYASRIAREYADSGRLEGGNWARLKGPHVRADDPPLVAFHLPGEPLYLGSWFRWMPSSIHRFAHVPVTTLLIVAVALTAGLIFGAKAALFAGTVASLHPFVVLHGPVWDDTFLGAALDWSALALLLIAAQRRELSSGIRWVVLLALAAVAFAAALTRSQSQALFIALGLCLAGLPVLRGMWKEALAVGIGTLLAVGGWGARNRIELGTWFFGSTHDGITLWESNYPHAIEALLVRGQVERLNPDFMQEEFAATAGMTELQADRYFAHRGLRHIRENPLEIARNGSVKLVVTLLGIRPEESWIAPRNLTAIAGNGVLFALAVVGLCGLVADGKRRMDHGSTRAARRQTAIFTAFCALTILGTLAMTAIGPVGLRYRIGTDGISWVFAALGALRLSTFQGASDSVDFDDWESASTDAPAARAA